MDLLTFYVFYLIFVCLTNRIGSGAPLLVFKPFFFFMVMKLFPEALIDSFCKSDCCPLEGPEVGKANNCCCYLVRRYVVEREMHETE